VGGGAKKLCAPIFIECSGLDAGRRSGQRPVGEPFPYRTLHDWMRLADEEGMPYDSSDEEITPKGSAKCNELGGSGHVPAAGECGRRDSKNGNKSTRIRPIMDIGAASRPKIGNKITFLKEPAKNRVKVDLTGETDAVTVTGAKRYGKKRVSVDRKEGSKCIAINEMGNTEESIMQNRI